MLSCDHARRWSVAVYRLGVHRTEANTGEITRWHPAALSPHTWIIGVYILAIYILQVGYCVILVFVCKPETKVCLLVTAEANFTANDGTRPLW